MHRHATILLLFATTAFAADPWEKTPYGEWSEKEVMSVLTNSPWAHGVPMQLKSTDARDANAYQAGVTADDRFGTGKDKQYAKTTLNLVWSGKVVRMAQLRQRQMKGAAPNPAEDEKFIAGPDPDYYVVVMQAPQFPPLAAETPEGLAAKTTVKVGGKKATKALKCERVDFPGGAKEVAVFFFARKDNPIAESDGELLFETKVGDHDISRGFDLADMKFENGLDL